MKELFKTFGRLPTLFRQRTHMHPTRDWFVLLGTSAVLVGISIAWNLWSYRALSTDIEGVVKSTDIPAFNTGPIEVVEAAFTVRAKEAEQYQSTYRFVDPSR